jgi:hypothetical protein
MKYEIILLTSCKTLLLLNARSTVSWTQLTSLRILRIYEDKVAGKVSETRCLRLMAKYEDEQWELRTSVDELETEISAERQRRADTLEFVGILAAYKDISGLTRVMLNELVERIEVHTVTEAKQGMPRVSVTYKQDICIENSLNQRQEVSGSMIKTFPGICGTAPVP